MSFHAIEDDMLVVRLGVSHTKQTQRKIKKTFSPSMSETEFPSLSGTIGKGKSDFVKSWSAIATLSKDLPLKRRRPKQQPPQPSNELYTVDISTRTNSKNTPNTPKISLDPRNAQKFDVMLDIGAVDEERAILEHRNPASETPETYESPYFMPRFKRNKEHLKRIEQEMETIHSAIDGCVWSEETPDTWHWGIDIPCDDSCSTKMFLKRCSEVNLQEAKTPVVITTGAEDPCPWW